MQRRSYLTAAGGVAAALAGCGEANPLKEGGPEYLRAREVDVPDSVSQPDAEIDIAVTIENTGETTGVYERPVILTCAATGEQFASGLISATVPAGETVVAETTVEVDEAALVIVTVANREYEVLVEPVSPAPVIDRVELLDEWNQVGDVAANAIDSLPAGEMGMIGVVYEYWHGTGGELDITMEATIRDSDGVQVNLLQRDARQSADVSGWGKWERAEPFGTEGYEPGTYAATVLIQDNTSRAISDAAATEFEIE